MSVNEIFEAHTKNELKEVFGVGTAVTLNPINSITRKNIKINIPPISNSYCSMLKKNLQDIQYGKEQDIFNWIIQV